MRAPLALLTLALFAAASLNASVIQGVILDDESGAPLARTSVTLVPIPGQPLAPVSVRVGSDGTFAFVNVHSGSYILRATHRGFLPAESGQKRAGRPGLPFAVDDSQDAPQFVQLRMYRLSAISGTVLDENGVGLPDVTVHAYTAEQPIVHLSQATSDDRGHFRIDRLDPGEYVVRSGAAVLDDSTPLLPTWYKGGAEFSDADRVTLRAAETFTDAVIRPVKGTLYKVSGEIMKIPAIPAGPVNLTVITETGRRLLTTGPGPFSAANIPPGPIELAAEGDDCGAYEQFSLQKDFVLRMTCSQIFPLRVDFVSTTGSLLPGVRYPLFARRVDLDGIGRAREVKPGEALWPGIWELRADAGPDRYVARIDARGSTRTESIHTDDWFRVRIAQGTLIIVAISSSPASIRGVVKTGDKVLAGAPVSLEWFNPDLPHPRLRLLNARSDAFGNYAFLGLAPGRYRVISSYDFDPTDPGAMDHAAVLELKEGEAVSQALETALP